MGEFTKGIKKSWDVAGLANDLRDAEWHITQGPLRAPRSYTRIDRMINIGSYERIERLVKNLLPKKEVEDAKKNDTLSEVLDFATQEYMNELATQVSDQMFQQHVYGTIDEGDIWLGQYEEGNFEKLAKEFNIAADDLKRHGLAKMSGSSLDGSGANALAVEFVNGASRGSAGAMYIQGNHIYSYGPHFPIAVRTEEGITITSQPSPSKTTTTHINAVKRAAESARVLVTTRSLPPE